MVFGVRVSMTFHHMCIHGVTICSLCILTICNFSYFPFWFLVLDLGTDRFSSWSLHTFYFFGVVT